MPRTLQRKNIRATTDRAFWGDEYEDSVYLWMAAKQGLTLDQMDKDVTPSLDDPFESQDALKAANELSRATYYKYLRLLSGRLNELHNLEMPTAFWQTAFGWWLYRHICAVYDKYAVLRQLDLDNTSIKLLSPRSFFIPCAHHDYWRCFCNTHGVLQLVSDYYSLFSTKPREEIVREYVDKDGLPNPFDPMRDLAFRNNSEEGEVDPGWMQALRSLAPVPLRRWVRRFRGAGVPPVALCGLFYTPEVLTQLAKRSGGRINIMPLPFVTAPRRPVDHGARAHLAGLQAEDPFEKFLVKTLYHAMPRIMVEYFRVCYDRYSRDLQTAGLAHIVTECWISYMPLSIYCAVARQEHGVRLVLQEHGASQKWLCGRLDWMTEEVADLFVTTGWTSRAGTKMRRGGFAVTDTTPYRFEPGRADILHVATTRFRYLCEFVGLSPGVRFAKYLRQVRRLIASLPPHLRQHYALRPRRISGTWDTEQLWDLGRDGIRVVPEGPLSKLLADARIVIIDHLSTAIAEILHRGVPCLVLHNDDIEPLADDCATLFSELSACGVAHGGVESLVKHLDAIYDDVEGWWTSAPVQKAVNTIANKFLGPPSRTVDCLLALLKEKGQPKLTRRKGFSEEASGDALS